MLAVVAALCEEGKVAVYRFFLLTKVYPRKHPPTKQNYRKENEEKRNIGFVPSDCCF